MAKNSTYQKKQYQINKAEREAKKSDKKYSKRKKKHLISNKPKACPYCNSPIITVRSGEYYHGNNDFFIHRCTNPDCTAYSVANYNYDERQMADVKTRRARQEAHYYFDQLYNEARLFETRSDAYVWLCSKMNMTREDCHMKYLTYEQCQEVIKHSKKKLNNKNYSKTPLAVYYGMPYISYTK